MSGLVFNAEKVNMLMHKLKKIMFNIMETKILMIFWLFIQCIFSAFCVFIVAD